MESNVGNEALPEPAPAIRGLRFSFRLGHLLTLMAGLGVGMAIMQPWKTWERPPAPVDYDVAVVSVQSGAAEGEKGKDSPLHKNLISQFGPKATSPSKEPIGKLLGTGSLSTIEGEAGVMEVTLPVPEGKKGTLDKFKIQVKPISARGPIRTSITSEFSWLPNFTAPTEQIVTHKTGESEVYELANQTTLESKQAVRIFVVLTPQDATKRQFKIQPASTSNNNGAK